MRMNQLTTIDFLNFFEEFFMKLSKHLFAFLLVSSAAWFTTVYAQDKHQSSADAVSAVSASHMAEGEIKKINGCELIHAHGYGPWLCSL